jgi:hypothetical protein
MEGDNLIKPSNTIEDSEIENIFSYASKQKIYFKTTSRIQ